MKTEVFPQFNQDLHIHTIFSEMDSQVVPEQTIALIAEINHSKIIGISDHFEMIEDLGLYKRTVEKYNFILGVEVDGSKMMKEAIDFNPDYFIYHCYDRDEDYKAIEKFLSTGKPFIIAHPHAIGTDLDRVPKECFVEINNRYIWRMSSSEYYQQYKDDFKFIFSSDAHQPNWLNQIIAQKFAKTLGIEETIIFDK